MTGVMVGLECSEVQLLTAARATEADEAVRAKEWSYSPQNWTHLSRHSRRRQQCGGKRVQESWV